MMMMLTNGIMKKLMLYVGMYSHSHIDTEISRELFENDIKLKKYIQVYMHKVPNIQTNLINTKRHFRTNIVIREIFISFFFIE